MDVATQIAQKAVATKGREKKTTCAEIVLKVAAIQGGEKRHVLKLRNRWRRHRKRSQIAQKAVATKGRENKEMC